GATAAMDISDGFAQDLGHLALASGLRAEVALERLPCVAGAEPRDAVRSGEEYELIVTAPAGLDLAAVCGPAVPLTPVGRMAHGAPGVSLTAGGQNVEVGPGHDHFSTL
ncbi:MAG: AIR synthase-related protein, partial [Gemmatimonadaceae bacterium]|nr:AIR synthase-related protein [Gemmatimonadaceae bacterium]